MSIIIKKIIDRRDVNICPDLTEDDIGKSAYWEVECSEKEYEELGGDAVLDLFESVLVDVYGEEEE